MAAAAAVAATLRHKRDHAEEDLANLVHFQAFDDNQQELLEQDRQRVGGSTRRLLQHVSMLDAWIARQCADGRSKRDWVLKELKERCVNARERNVHYRNLVSFILFTGMFIGVLYIQRRPEDNHEITNLMASYLPEKLNGELDNPMSSWTDVHQAVSSQITSVWEDPECGNGLCEPPFETPGWGHISNRHGCEADCGVMPNVTLVTATLDYMRVSHGMLAQKLAEKRVSEFAVPTEIRWNLCSLNNDRCWFRAGGSTAGDWGDVPAIQPGEVVVQSFYLVDDQYYLELQGTTQYLRGHLVAGSAMEEGCSTACNAAGGSCSFTCSNPSAIDAETTQAMEGDVNTTSSVNSTTSNSTTPNVTASAPSAGVEAGGRVDHLMAFEMCKYNPGTDNRTWLNFYVPQNLSGVNSQGTNELVVPGWNFLDRVYGVREEEEDSDTSDATTTSPTAAAGGTAVPTFAPGATPTQLSAPPPDSPPVGNIPLADGPPTGNTPMPNAPPSGNPPSPAAPQAGDNASVPGPPGGRRSLLQGPGGDGPGSVDGPGSGPGKGPTCHNCTDVFTFQTCRELGSWQMIGNMTLAEFKEAMLEDGDCLCVGDPAPPFTDDSRLAELCHDFFCTTPKQCNSKGMLTLEQGRFPWEGILKARVMLNEFPDFQITTSFCSNSWTAEDALVACRQLGYSGVLSHYLSTTFTDQDVNNLGSNDKISDSIFRRTGGESAINIYIGQSTFFGAVKCQGWEPSIMQCDMDYGFYSPDVDYSHQTSNDMGGCGPDQVVNLQCWPGYEEYVDTTCSGSYGGLSISQCCSSECVPRNRDLGNGVNNWPLPVYYDGAIAHATCYEDSIAEEECNAPLQGDGICDVECMAAGCFMDNWDCCAEGEVVDPHSGHGSQCCSPSALDKKVHTLFTLNKFNAPDNEEIVFHGFGRNRIVGGALIHQTRLKVASNNNRFSKLYDYKLSDEPSLRSYGMNPYLYSVSKIYDEDIDPMSHYSSDELVYEVSITGDNQTLYMAFQHVDIDGFEPGFTVAFSNSLYNNQAMELLDYMKYGHYYDYQTKKVEVKYVTYNSDLDLFCILTLSFNQMPGGSIVWQYAIIPVDMNLYTESSDWIRLVFEVGFMIAVMMSAYSESCEMYQTYATTGSLLGHFTSLWNYVDALSISVSLVSICVWVFLASYSSVVFNIDLVYDVYVQSPNLWGRLSYKENELKNLAMAFHQLHIVASLQSTYISLCGANMFLFLMRIFKLMDFQPRMGILTRTMRRAMDDLLHFFLLLGIVLLVYVMIGTIIFGPTVEVFSSISKSTQTIFDMLLGEFATTEQLLLSEEVDRDLMTIPSVMFFYSFMSIVFLVILNFLLAIVVDAFSDEKNEKGEHDSSLFADVSIMTKRFMQSIASQEFRVHKSLQTIEAQVEKMQAQSSPAVVVSRGDEIGQDRVPILEMYDEENKVLLDESMLRRVLQSVKSDEALPPTFVGAAVEAFGATQDSCVLQQPVMVAQQDPSFIKLLELQNQMDKLSEAMESMQRTMVTIAKRHVAPVAPLQE